jgi:hypothetical protein
MVELLADFDIKSWICILQYDVLLGFQECFGIEGFARAGLG